MAQQNEITIRQIIQAIITWYRFLLSKWKMIVAIAFIGGLAGLVYSLVAKKLYKAELTFALEEKGSGGGALGSIASQFGFDFGKGENGAFSGDNILELAKSREIMQRALFTPVFVDNKEQLLINRFVEFNKLDIAWGKSEFEELKKLKFTSAKPADQFSIVEDSVLYAVIDGLRNSLYFSRVDKKSAIIKVEFQSYDQHFAKYFTEALVANVSEFYIDTKTRKLRNNILLLENRIDSIKQALDNQMSEAAANQDANQNATRMRVRLPYAKTQMNIQILTTLYGELIKNLELAKMSLMREEPLIQMIDKPKFPIKFTKPRKIISSLFGSITAGLFCCLFLIIGKLYKEENLNI